MFYVNVLIPYSYMHKNIIQFFVSVYTNRIFEKQTSMFLICWDELLLSPPVMQVITLRFPVVIFGQRRRRVENCIFFCKFFSLIRIVFCRCPSKNKTRNGTFPEENVCVCWKQLKLFSFDSLNSDEGLKEVCAINSVKVCRCEKVLTVFNYITIETYLFTNCDIFLLLKKEK